MPSAHLRLVPKDPGAPRPSDAFYRSPPQRDLGHVLRAMGVVTGDQLIFARQAAGRLGIGLGDYLRRNRMVSGSTLVKARSRATGLPIEDPLAAPPDPRLIDRLGASRCLRDGILPLRSVGDAILVASDDAERDLSLYFPDETVLPVLAERTAMRTALLRLRSRQLSRRAEVRTDEDFSCRDWPIRGIRIGAMAVAAACLVWATLLPFGFLAMLLGWTVLTMVALLTLKLAAAVLHLARGPIREDDPAGDTIPLARRPEVSILVPLFREREIAARLVARLARLTYPKELLEVILIVEAGDTRTRAVLDATELPAWFSVVEVPEARIRTKPRALNYALDFARGQVIGIYDAEDAPEPGQIERIVARFQRRGPEVACLQGRLDYYNPRDNWLARCFTIEYATWFRIVLPGLERLGLPVPLGGTTVFFRRAALEGLGAWDAHNVTEDADLGIRLARAGLRTELVDTVTQEEANCRLWPWVRQRSRWLKGYAVTWAVHMRSPRRLLKDLGFWRFAGFQVLFLGTLTQFALAPLLWSFWPALFGFWHPFQTVIGAEAIRALAVIFIASELVSMTVSALAVAPRDRRFLIKWVPTMMAYFPFATLAAVKGLTELFDRPFFWDKTAHGRSRAV